MPPDEALYQRNVPAVVLLALSDTVPAAQMVLFVTVGDAIALVTDAVTEVLVLIHDPLVYST